MYPFVMRVVFLCGFILGVLLAIIIVPLNNKSSTTITKVANENEEISTAYNRWLKMNKLRRIKFPMDYIRYRNHSLTLESHYLYNKVKIQCIVLVHKIKNAKSANATWAKHCNYVTFVNLTEKSINKAMPMKQRKKNSSWSLLCKALQDVSLNYNWILIVKDDTFALIENLRYMVASLNYSKEYYLGHPITFWSTTYNVAQAGYTLSRGSIRTFQTKFKSSETCASSGKFWNQEDLYLGKHLSSLNILPADTRDENGLATFHGFNLGQLLFPGSLKTFANYYKYSLYPTLCCSPNSVTFQAIEGDKMHTYHYLLYQLQIFKSGSLGNRAAKIPKEEVWKTFLHSQGIFKDFVSAEEYYKIWENLVNDPAEFNQNLRRHESPFKDA